MIFVTVGNWYTGFDRLIAAVDELVANEVVSEEVVAQTGPGKYKPKYLQAMPFCTPEDFTRALDESRLIISHAGMGTIAQGIKRRKPVIVVPRKAALGEHFDDHQFSTARILKEEGKILVAYETTELAARIQEAEEFVPAQDGSANDILRAVGTFIDAVHARRCGDRHE